MARSPFLSVVVLTAMASFFVACKEEAPRREVVRPVRAMTLGDPAELIRRKFPGQAIAENSVNLSFRVTGQLMELPARVGLKVNKGDVLGQLDPRDFQVNLRNAQAQLGLAKADAAIAAEEFEQATKAHRAGGVSEIELSRAREKSAGAEAQVESLEAAVEAQQDALAYATLKAPFSGTVTTVEVDNFQEVRAGQVVLRLIDDATIEMEISIPETMISLAQYVEETTCEFDAFRGRPIVSTISKVSSEADSITRTYTLTLLMKQPADFKILPGMTGQAWVSKGQAPTDAASEGMQIPLAAIANREEAPFVWIIELATSAVRKQAVTVGRLTTLGARVQGLETGQTIVTAGVHYLGEGQKVRILGSGETDQGATP